MCWVCNPVCGGCQPPRKKTVFCPQCGALSLFDITIQAPPIPRRCASCGLDVTGLATPETVHCINSGLLCANPCGYHLKAPISGTPTACAHNTPPPVSGETSA